MPSLALSVAATSDLPSVRRIAWGGAAIVLVLHVTRTASGAQGPTPWLTAIDAVMCGVTPVLVVRHVLAATRVTTDKLLGVLSSYLLIGLFFAVVYLLLVQSSEGIFVDDAVTDIGDAIYFSFTTLTTVGYGDIMPLHPLARGLAVLEAAIGPVYLAIVVARLVGLKQSDDRDSAGSGTES